MSWAGKLLKKLVSPLDAWESVPTEDPKDLANAESLLNIDDLVLVILKEDKRMDKIKPVNQCRAEQARAWRELVEVCSSQRIETYNEVQK